MLSVLVVVMVIAQGGMGGWLAFRRPLLRQP